MVPRCLPCSRHVSLLVHMLWLGCKRCPAPPRCAYVHGRRPALAVTGAGMLRNVCETYPVRPQTNAAGEHKYKDIQAKARATEGGALHQ